jgi:hypothetical protein
MAGRLAVIVEGRGWYRLREEMQPTPSDVVAVRDNLGRVAEHKLLETMLQRDAHAHELREIGIDFEAAGDLADMMSLYKMYAIVSLAREVERISGGTVKTE